MRGFWEAIRDGADLQRPVPLERWDVDRQFDPEGRPGAAYVRFAAFTSDADLADAAYFRLGRSEAVALDPQTRILMQVSAEALSEAGWPGRETGTYIGCMFVDYMNLQREGYGLPSTGAVMTGSGAPYQGGRVAYTFGLQGPCNGIDTACSSSLVAAHNAHRGIIGGECSAALAGGINIMLWHDVTAGICQLQALSPVGRCKSFETSADGYGRGEGFNAFVLRGARPPHRGGPGDPAVAERGVPAAAAPVVALALISKALGSGGHEAADVSYIAVHGTGTPLGDPIEVGALAAALTSPDSPGACLGSVKACYGHTEGAAGVTGAFLAITALRERCAPAIMGLRNMNPYVAAALGDWEKRSGRQPLLPRATTLHCVPSLAGTSSFGMSGVNAHMLFSSRQQEITAPELAMLENPNPKAPLSWRPQRFWLGPTLCHLAHPVSADSTSGTLRFSADMGKAALAFLRDHAVSGRPLCPATALLEAAVEAGRMLKDDSSSGLLLLQGSTFSKALLLSRSSQALLCTVLARTGMVHIGSSTASSAAEDIHATSTFGFCASEMYQTPATRNARSALGLVLSAAVARKRLEQSMAVTVGRIDTLGRHLAGYYMHPAVADSSLHISAIPDRPTTEATSGRVPISLGALAAPGRRNALLRAPWAGSASRGDAARFGGGSVTGDMTVAPQLLYAVQWLAEQPVPGKPKRSNALSAHSQQITVTMRQTSMRQCIITRSGAGHSTAWARTAAETPSLQVTSAQQSPYTSRRSGRVSPMGGSPGSALLRNSSFGLREAFGVLCAPRLQPMTAGDMGQSVQGQLIWPQSALITGGLGGIGLLTAHFMALSGLESLLLLGRSGRVEIGAAAFGNACVTLRRCDVSSKEEAAVAAASWALSQGPPGGATVVHAGGVLADGLLPSQTLGSLRRVFAPKLAGARHLAAAMVAAPLAAAAAFSSIAGVLGSPGQGNYAAANSALDAWVDTQRHEGVAWTSLQWGAWSGVGMAAASSALLGRLQRQGYGAVAPAQGLGVLSQLLSQQVTSPAAVTVNPFDWSLFLTGVRSSQAFFEDVRHEVPSASSASTSVGSEPDAGRTPLNQPALKERDILPILSGLARDVMGAEVAPDEPLMSVGLDSLAAVELRNAVSARFGASLPATVALDYPTLQALAAHIATILPQRSMQSVAPVQAAQLDRDAVKRTLKSLVKDILGAELADLAPFMEAGLDSLGAVELRNAVRAYFSVEVPATLTLDYPTTDALAAYLGDLLAQRRVAAPITAGPENILALAERAVEPSAVDVMSAAAMYPGAERSGMEGFWEGLAACRDVAETTPADRWDADFHYSQQGAKSGTYARFGAYCADVTAFDAAYFRLPASEALALDPHTRLLLTLAQEALVDAAGMIGTGGKTGVFVGCMWSHEFLEVLPQLGVSDISAAASTGNTFPFMVGRVSFTFGLSGPCVSTDTACSSSLVALHLAQSAVTKGECGSALAAGVNAMLSPKTAVKICQLQALSIDGRCKTFEASADGYGRGEAFAVGSAINQDGRSSSLTAPNGPSQNALISAAMSAADLAPADVAAIAVHGTGTPLGDPLEIGAIGGALAERRGDRVPRRLALVSVKSVYGHTEGAAGLTGLLAAMCALTQRAAAPVNGLRSMNPYVGSTLADWRARGLTAQVPQQLAAGPGLQPHHCIGTSSFGLSGVNCHTLLAAPDQAVMAGASRQALPWRPARCWAGPRVSALLTSAMASLLSSPQQQHAMVFACNLSAPHLAFLQDHRVNKRALVPGTAFFEVALAAAVSLRADPETSVVALAAATISSPCMLASSTPADANPTGAENDGSIGAQILECAAWFGAGGSLAAGAVEVRSRTGGTSPPTAGGTSQPVAKGPTHLSCVVVSLAAAWTGYSRPESGKGVHALAAAVAAPQDWRDRAAGATLPQPVNRSGARSTVAIVALPRSCAGHIGKSGYNVYPAAADCSLHLGAVARSTDSALSQHQPSKIPVGFGAYTASTSATHAGSNGWAVAGEAETLDKASAISDAWWLPVTGQGSGSMSLQGLLAKQLSPIPQAASKAARTENVQENVVCEAQLQADHTLALTEPVGLMSHRQRGLHVSIVDRTGKKRSLLLRSCGRNAITGVHVPAHADITLVLPAGRPQVHGANVGSTALEVWQQVAAGRQSSKGAASGSCFVSTHGSLNGTTVSRGTSESGGGGAALWGMLRCAALELPSLNWRGVDHNAATPPATSAQHEASSGVAGDSCDGPVFKSARLLRSEVSHAAGPFHLTPSPRGSLSSLVAAPLPTTTPLSHQVLLAVNAVGLNFRDVLNVLGMYPGDPGEPGGDVAGIVAAVGRDVRHLHRVGDAVFGQAAGCLGSAVLC
ncbi:g5141 [Coccomyxa elongata]